MNTGKRFVIPGFELAMPRVVRCEHKQVRYWGTVYKNGVRCLECNAELSRSFLDNAQSGECDAR